MKEWLLGVVEEEEKGTEGTGDKWQLFTQLAQSIWEHDASLNRLPAL
jgi:hypothetical protein